LPIRIPAPTGHPVVIQGAGMIIALTIEAACELAAEHFGYSFDTLMTYYFRYSDELKPDFSLD
jgi:hypothetical protein